MYEIVVKILQKAKSPTTEWPPGKWSDHWRLNTLPLVDELAPIESVWPAPGIPWLKQAVADPDIVVGRREVLSIGYDRRPSIQPSPRFQCPHQAQLKLVSAMFPQHPNPTKIPGIAGMGRGDDAGKGDRLLLAKSEPPITVITVLKA
jgi:hypothetical protein